MARVLMLSLQGPPSAGPTRLHPDRASLSCLGSQCLLRLRFFEEFCFLNGSLDFKSST